MEWTMTKLSENETAVTVDFSAPGLDFDFNIEADPLFEEIKLLNRPESGEEGIKLLMEGLIDRVVEQAEFEGRDAGEVLNERLYYMPNIPRGEEFAAIIRNYWLGYIMNDEDIMVNAVRLYRKVFWDKDSNC